MRLDTWYRAAPLLLCLGGCLDPFQTPSAYDEHVFLCPDERAWRDAVEGCVARRDAGEGCHGLLSLEGALLHQPLRLFMPLRWSEMTTLVPAGEEGVWLNRAEASGVAPYFNLTLILGSVGGAVPATGTGGAARDLRLDENADILSDGLRDDLASVALRLAAAGQREIVFGRTGSGALRVQAPGGARLLGRFHGAFGAGVVAGCFALLADEVRVEAAP